MRENGTAFLLVFAGVMGGVVTGLGVLNLVAVVRVGELLTEIAGRLG